MFQFPVTSRIKQDHSSLSNDCNHSSINHSFIDNKNIAENLSFSVISLSFEPRLKKKNRYHLFSPPFFREDRNLYFSFQMRERSTWIRNINLSKTIATVRQWSFSEMFLLTRETFATITKRLITVRPNAGSINKENSKKRVRDGTEGKISAKAPAFQKNRRSSNIC